MDVELGSAQGEGDTLMLAVRLCTSVPEDEVDNDAEGDADDDMEAEMQLDPLPTGV